MIAVQVHDLVRLDDPAAQLTGNEPAWVRPALTETPWVVVRRAVPSPGFLAVGVRGTYRHHRHALEVPQTSALEVVWPDDLRPSSAASASEPPAITALREAIPLLDDFGHPWGPTGSVGFQLATGHPAVTSRSDLDLVVRLPELPAPEHLATLAAGLRTLPTPVDCQLDTARGAINLAEFASGTEKILLRTLTGAHLVAIDEVLTR